MSRAAEEPNVRSSSFRPRIRTVLLIVNLVILLLPLGGIAALRLYENELIRRTESELVAQGAFVAAAYQEALLAELADDQVPAYGNEVAPRFLAAENQVFSPIRPSLDLAIHDVHAPAVDPTEPLEPADEHAVAAGERVMPMMRLAKNTTLAGIRVVDARGTVVASTRGELGRSLQHREEVARALVGERVSLMRTRQSDSPTPPLESISRGTRVRVFVALPIVVDGRVLGAVVLSRTPIDVGKALYNNRAHLATGAFVLLLVVLVVSVFTSLTISQPVAKLIGQIEMVGAGDLEAAEPLPNPGTREVAQLSDAFVDMARQLAERNDYITSFARNVSHEFKTPLTGIRGAVELIRDHFDTMTRQERERFLDNVDKDAERLDRLVGRLLDLARADVYEPGGTERTHVTEALEGLAEARGVTSLELDVTLPPDTTVPMDEETFVSVVGNLLDNARQHGGESVSIALSSRREGNLVLVEVSDDGPGITGGNIDRVFDAFFTTARATGGSGLGLNIVRSLVTAHDGTVAVSSPGRLGGATFTVSLPVVDPKKTAERRARGAFTA